MMKRRIPPAVSSGVSLVVGAVAVAASASRALYAVALWAIALAVYTRSQAVAAALGAVAMFVAGIASRGRPPAEVAVVGVVGVSLLIAAAAPLLQRTIRRRASHRHSVSLLAALRRGRHPARGGRRLVQMAPGAARAVRAGAAATVTASRHRLLSSARLIFREQWAATSGVLNLTVLGAGWFQPFLLGRPLGSLLVTLLAAISDPRVAAAAVAGETFLAALLVATGRRAAGESLALLPFLTLLGLLVRLAVEPGTNSSAIGDAFDSGAPEETPRTIRSIAIVTPTLMIRGGTQQQLLQFALECMGRGIRVRVITFAFSPADTYDEFSKVDVQSVVRFRAGSSLLRLARRLGFSAEQLLLYVSLFESRRLVRLVAEADADIVNPHDWYGLWIASFESRKSGSRAPIVVMLNDLPPGMMARSGLKRLLLSRVDRRAASRAAGIMVLSEKTRAAAEAHYRRPVKVVRSGVNIDAYGAIVGNRPRLLDLYGIPSGADVVACAGIPAPQRRFEDVIDAVATLPARVHLLVVGDLTFDHRYGARLRERVRDLGLEPRVRFEQRWLPFAERAELLASSDVYVHPNEEQTWGLAVIEVMSLGVATVVSTGAGVAEVLEHERTSLLFEPRDVPTLAVLLRRLLSDPAARGELARAGQQHVRANYSWQRYTDRVLQLMAKPDLDASQAPTKAMAAPVADVGAAGPMLYPARAMRKPDAS